MYERQNQRPEVWRILLALVFPPLAVLDKGCGTASLVFLLTMFGWFPGIVLALVIITADSPLRFSSRPKERRFIEIPGGELTIVNDRRFVDIPLHPEEEKAKRKGAFVHLEDGAVAEVIEDDGEPPQKLKRGI